VRIEESGAGRTTSFLSNGVSADHPLRSSRTSVSGQRRVRIVKWCEFEWPDPDSECSVGGEALAFAPLIWEFLPDFVRAMASTPFWLDTTTALRLLGDGAGVASADAVVVPLAPETVDGVPRLSRGPRRKISFTPRIQFQWSPWWPASQPLATLVLWLKSLP